MRCSTSRPSSAASNTRAGRGTPSESVSGGAIYDWGSHHVDWILQLMGDPTPSARHGHKRVWHDVTNLDQVRVRLGGPTAARPSSSSPTSPGSAAEVLRAGHRGNDEGHYRPLAPNGSSRVADTSARSPTTPRHRSTSRLARYDGWRRSDRADGRPCRPAWAFHRNLADHLLLGEPLDVTPRATRERRRACSRPRIAPATEGGNLIDTPTLSRARLHA